MPDTTLPLGRLSATVAAMIPRVGRLQRDVIANQDLSKGDDMQILSFALTDLGHEPRAEGCKTGGDAVAQELAERFGRMSVEEDGFEAKGSKPRVKSGGPFRGRGSKAVYG
ncbi:hypothetical protein MKK84_11215 [Methylobacterium sp. E-065]|uniref:hypothetical protein n=1 Tax=Methylobacterium sp. E-065 TaxID=2836583 RepID=UPI001FBA74C9|nr:hypothetical protein [Methylobacterium sp. E-065]MCJ2017988.1 hypothetical protein [Methylobacterium sp. E-065]